jgi:hypothetical protein
MLAANCCIISGVVNRSWKGVAMTPGAHAIRRQLFGQSLGEAHDAGFGRSVNGGARTSAVMAGNRADVDDHTAPPLHHLAHDRLRAEKDALEIEVYDSIPQLFAEIADRRALDQIAGVVDQNVNRAQSGADGGDHLVDAVAR